MKGETKIKAVFGIALLYTVVTSMFLLLHDINTILIGGTQVIKLRKLYFIKRSTIWIIIVAAIIVILIIYIKKSNQKVSKLIAEYPIILMVVGVLVAIKGASDLTSVIPNGLINLEIFLESHRFINEEFLPVYKEKALQKTIVTNTLPVLIALTQTILGIVLVKIYKRRAAKNAHEDSAG